MNIFQEMFYAVVGTKKYIKFLKNRKGKTFLYVIVLVLLYTVIANWHTLPTTKEVLVALEDAVKKCPDFELTSGKLHVGEAIMYEEAGNLIVIESEFGSYINESSILDWKDMLSEYKIAFILDETTILIKNDEDLQKMDYPESLSISRNMIIESLDVLYVFVWIYLVLAYLLSVVGYFFAALFVALAGLIICSFMNQNLTFGQLYLLSLYAKTLPLLIKGVLKLSDLSFFGFSVISFAVACIYLGYAVYQKKLADEEAIAYQNPYEDPIVF